MRKRRILRRTILLVKIIEKTRQPNTYAYVTAIKDW